MIRLQMDDQSLKGNVFMSTDRDVTVCAINRHNTPQKFDRDIPIRVQLLYADNLQPVDERVLVFAPQSESAISKKTSRCMLKFRFSESCASHENKHFVLSATSTSRDLVACRSSPFLVIRYQLLIDHENTAIPLEWYKDQGGQHKHMILKVRLGDAERKAVRTKSIVHLILRLLYQEKNGSTTSVTDQNILSQMPESQAYINADGQAIIRFRLTEVSATHRKKPFCILVGPDRQRSPLNSDIAPTISTPVIVRSKKPKAKTRRKIDKRKQRTAPSGPMAKRGRTMVNQLPTPSKDIITKMESMIATLGPKPMHKDEISHAVHKVCCFATTASELMQQLEWQTTGYAIGADGTINDQQPIFRCPSCYAYFDGTQQRGRAAKTGPIVASHKDGCPLQLLLTRWETLVHPEVESLLRHAQSPGTGDTVEVDAVPSAPPRSNHSPTPPPPPDVLHLMWRRQTLSHLSLGNLYQGLSGEMQPGNCTTDLGSFAPSGFIHSVPLLDSAPVPTPVSAAATKTTPENS